VNKAITIEEVKQNLEMRDYMDSNRKISPLRQATDAVVLDNSNLTMAQQLKIALQWAHEKINENN
jgi:cytidylate kinase